jgi:pyrroline-5-carboxylate reductase
MTEIAVEATEVPAQLPKVRVAVLGAGKMGGILLQAFLKRTCLLPTRFTPPWATPSARWP